MTHVVHDLTTAEGKAAALADYLAANERGIRAMGAALLDVAQRKSLVNAALDIMRREFARSAISDNNAGRVVVPRGDLEEAGKYLSNYLAQLEEAERQLTAASWFKA